jgi:alpha/beta superfamily hydrolase
MANIIQELICKGPLEEVRDLKAKVLKLEDKLQKKQHDINKTNAFYKNKIRELKAAKR